MTLQSFPLIQLLTEKKLELVCQLYTPIGGKKRVSANSASYREEAGSNRAKKGVIMEFPLIQLLTEKKLVRVYDSIIIRLILFPLIQLLTEKKHGTTIDL